MLPHATFKCSNSEYFLILGSEGETVGDVLAVIELSSRAGSVVDETAEVDVSVTLNIIKIIVKLFCHL